MPTAAQEKFKELKKQIADSKKEAKTSAKAVFAEVSAEVFEKIPNLMAFGWAQYTPYFNDGDACTFSSYHEYPFCVLKMADGNTLKYDENYGEFSVYEDGDDADVSDEDRAKYEEEFSKVSKQVAKFLKNFDDDDMEAMFGDHVEVTAKRNGKTSIEQYTHD